MQVVINIPDKYADMAKSGKYNLNGGNCALAIRDAVMNGAVLPKGHGRLVDADALKISMERREDEQGSSDRSMWESATVDAALDVLAPTVLEADKE